MVGGHFQRKAKLEEATNEGPTGCYGLLNGGEVAKMWASWVPLSVLAY